MSKILARVSLNLPILYWFEVSFTKTDQVMITKVTQPASGFQAKFLPNATQ